MKLGLNLLTARERLCYYGFARSLSFSLLETSLPTASCLSSAGRGRCVLAEDALLARCRKWNVVRTPSTTTEAFSCLTEECLVPLELLSEADVQLHGQGADPFLITDYYPILAALVKAKSPRVVVEIGVRYGYSLGVMLDASPSIEHAFAFDTDVLLPSQNKHGQVLGAYAIARDHLVQMWQGGRWPHLRSLNFFDCNTQTVETLSFAGMAIDFAYVDGNHSPAGCIHDLSLLLPSMAHEGQIVVDDADYCGLRSWVEVWALWHRFPCTYLPDSSGRGRNVVAVQDSSPRSLPLRDGPLDLRTKSEAERQAAQQLIRQVYSYERVGYDKRPMVFLADGTIGLGAAGREVFWDLRREEDTLVLQIGSETEPTCALVQGEAGTWVGEWLLAEKMPVFLDPRDRAVASMAPFPAISLHALTPQERFAAIQTVYAQPSLLRIREDAENAGLDTILDSRRLLQLLALLLYSLPLEGDTIECGVYKGGLSAIIARAIAGWNKRHYLCDSFVGLPESGAMDNHHHQGDFNDTSLDRIYRGLQSLELTPFVDIVHGWFADTLPALSANRFCFAHIDADLYQSTLECLQFLYPRMSCGGWIVIDDYTWPQTQGVRKAVDTFFANKPETVMELSGHAAAVQRLD